VVTCRVPRSDLEPLLSATSALPGTAAASKGLKANALGLTSSIVIATASVAPAYSLAASLGLVVDRRRGAGADHHAAGVRADALHRLRVPGSERDRPDCGTTFTWGARVFGPKTGWLGGWAIIVADVIVMANLAQIAGQYGFQLVGANGLAASAGWSEVAGIIWIALMTLICYIGIEVSARMQVALLSIELLMLACSRSPRWSRSTTGTAPRLAAHLRLLVQPLRHLLVLRADPRPADRAVHLLGLGYGGLGQ
jgi:hypothetical protein